jgi:hypothetical protein
MGLCGLCGLGGCEGRVQVMTYLMTMRIGLSALVILVRFCDLF